VDGISCTHEKDLRNLMANVVMKYDCCAIYASWLLKAIWMKAQEDTWRGQVLHTGVSDEVVMSDFKSFFDSVTASRVESSPLEIAEYWAKRRGKGAPTADGVVHEQDWERIVLAADRGDAVTGEVLGRFRNGWSVIIDSVAGWLPDDWVSAAGTTVAVGRIELVVLRYDRVTEELVLRPRLPGE